MTSKWCGEQVKTENKVIPFLMRVNFCFSFFFSWMLLNATTGDVILVRKSEPPETISEIQFSPGKRPIISKRFNV